MKSETLCKCRRLRDGNIPRFASRQLCRRCLYPCRHGLHARQRQTLDTGFVMIVECMLNTMFGKSQLRQNQCNTKQQQAFHTVCLAHWAQVPRTSYSTCARRKPRGSFGGAGGAALRQNTPPHPVHRKWTWSPCSRCVLLAEKRNTPRTSTALSASPQATSESSTRYNVTRSASGSKASISA